MSFEEQSARTELHAWQQQGQRPLLRLDRWARRVQVRLNALLPERVHQAITFVIKQMVRGVLFGSTHTTRWPLAGATLAVREAKVRARIRDYRTMATAEGAVTGAGGFLLGLAAFDWRTFQQEYRDYIDLAKMAQLVPGTSSVSSTGAWRTFSIARPRAWVAWVVP